MKRLMVVAGTDSSGGAGLTRDTAVASELGFQTLPVVTAVTAQTDRAVHLTVPIDPAAVVAQMQAAFAGTPPDAVKIGMLGSAGTAAAVASFLAGHKLPVVLDPVLKASSGGTLFSGRSFADLFPVVTLVTPNLDEAAMLSGCPKATSLADIAEQAEILMRQGARAVLVKGGHGEGAESIDHLFHEGGHQSVAMRRLPSARRGTGCYLSTAIACRLATGEDLPTACRRAAESLHYWLRA